MDNYCEYHDSECEYLTICRDHINEYACIKDLLGKDLIIKPEYSPEAILERITFYKDKPLFKQ